MGTFFRGLIFGAGFTISFCLLASAWFYWVLPTMLDTAYSSSYVMGPDGEWTSFDGEDFPMRFSSGEIELDDAASNWSVPSSRKMRGFDYRNATVLEPGSGRLGGRLLVQGRGLAGVRMRLALNLAEDEDRYTAWAVTGPDGEYTLELPPGSYRVDGYELADPFQIKALRGLTSSPANDFPDQMLTVEAGRTTIGPDLRFVAPVRKLPMPDEVDLGQPIILAWQPYSDAASYGVRVWESVQPEPDSKMNRLFECGEDERVEKPFVNLHDFDLDLKAGHFYQFEVTAYDADGVAIAESWQPTMTHQRFRLSGG